MKKLTGKEIADAFREWSPKSGIVSNNISSDEFQHLAANFVASENDDVIFPILSSIFSGRNQIKATVVNILATFVIAYEAGYEQAMRDMLLPKEEKP